MKQLLFGIACFGSLVLASCEKNEMPVYDTSYTALNIWFGTSSNALDSTTYNYSYKMGEGTLTFYARVMGVPVDYDRTFELEVYDGDTGTAAGSYWTETYTIGAGETEVECNIYFDTSKLTDADSFTETDGHLCFRMAANDTFLAGTEDRTNLIVVLKNYLSKPDEWDSATYPLRPYSAYFGTYSKVKYQFMISELGLVDFHINYSTSTPYDEETNTISSAYASYLVQKLKVALEEYNNDLNNTDTPLRDETGSVVSF